MLDLAHERDRVTALLTTEAVPHALLGAHRERRRLLLMERAQPLEATADAFQRDVLAHQRDEIRRFSHSRDVVVENAHRVQAMGSRRGSHAPWKLFGTPAEQLDTQTERVPIGHPAHVPDGNRGRLERARGEVGAHPRRGGWHPGRRVDEEVDQPAQQTDDLLGLAPGRGPEIDPFEVEGTKRCERPCRRLGTLRLALSRAASDSPRINEVVALARRQLPDVDLIVAELSTFAQVDAINAGDVDIAIGLGCRRAPRPRSRGTRTRCDRPTRRPRPLGWKARASARSGCARRRGSRRRG